MRTLKSELISHEIITCDFCKNEFTPHAMNAVLTMIYWDKLHNYLKVEMDICFKCANKYGSRGHSITFLKGKK